MPKRHTYDTFTYAARIRHGNKYDYTEVSYVNSTTKISIICPVHGSFFQQPQNHLTGQGCPKCGGSIRRTRDEVLDKFRAVHGNYYDYSLVVYENDMTPVIVICPNHGQFLIAPNSHRYGPGCRACGYERLSKIHSHSIDVFVAIANTKHNNKYDYSQSVYVNNSTLIAIRCPSHGLFYQIPSDHIDGHGCPSCGIESRAYIATLDHTKVLTQFEAVHGDAYTYDRFEYDGGHVKSTITCSKHGDFLQSPHAHKSGQGCPKCTSIISKPSQMWLDSLDIPNDHEHREVGGLIPGKRYIVDGYDPITNTVYEFHGDYWHGNPNVYPTHDVNKKVGKTYGQLYDDTVRKRQEFVAAQYEYVEIWEHDWQIDNPCTIHYGVTKST